jgi:hypothetical protein
MLYVTTASAILCLMNYDRRKGMFCSGLLFGFWLLVSLTTIPDVIDYSIEYKQGVKHFRLLEILLIYSMNFIEQICSYIKRSYSCLAAFSFCICIVYRQLSSRKI